MNPEGVSPPVAGYSHVAQLDLAGGGRLLFIAGQIAVDGDGRLVGPGDLAAQAEFCFQQIKGIVEACGGAMSDVIKLTTHLTDISRRAELAAVRDRYIADPPPTSTLVEVSRLARDEALIEIEAVAAVR